MKTSQHSSSEGKVLPGLHGVDHIGITVPDIEQATAFFVDVVCCNIGTWDSSGAHLLALFGRLCY
jgi:hypothetical protein